MYLKRSFRDGTRYNNFFKCPHQIVNEHETDCKLPCRLPLFLVLSQPMHKLWLNYDIMKRKFVSGFCDCIRIEIKLQRGSFEKDEAALQRILYGNLSHAPISDIFVTSQKEICKFGTFKCQSFLIYVLNIWLNLRSADSDTKVQYKAVSFRVTFLKINWTQYKHKTITFSEIIAKVLIEILLHILTQEIWYFIKF